jgi:hypothetical protein
MKLLSKELASLKNPTVDSPLSAIFTHKGHKIIRAINLDQSSQSIHQDLLALVA